jgi:cytochrome c553
VRRWIVRIVVVLALTAIGASLVVVSGVIPIAASAGHWPITEWMLHLAMRRSVATHSLAIEARPLDDPALVLKGATHYHSVCGSCHGNPEHQRPVIAQAMLPPAVDLDEVVEWKTEELFYVVKHGVKFTGMPAWPAQQRDDEVWAVVAFLRRLPALDAEEYRRLALGEAPADAGTPASGSLEGSDTSRTTLRSSCARCHGADGLGRGAAFPRLAGQQPDYLRNALEAYARGERYSGIMQPVAASLVPETIQELTSYFSSLPPAPASQGDPAAIARGEAIAHQGIPGQSVPSCVDCHGPNPTGQNPAYPRHAGQPADYLALQLELFKRDQRGGSAYASLMRPIASRLTAEQMRDVAAYYASLPAESRAASK